jgi:hypothetical protein
MQVGVAKEFGRRVCSFTNNMAVYESGVIVSNTERWHECAIWDCKSMPASILWSCFIAKIICEGQIDAGAEKKQEVFIEMFFSDEGVTCVAATQSLLEHWDGMSALRIVMRSVIYCDVSSHFVAGCNRHSQ